MRVGYQGTGRHRRPQEFSVAADLFPDKLLRRVARRLRGQFIHAKDTFEVGSREVAVKYVALPCQIFSRGTGHAQCSDCPGGGRVGPLKTRI